MQISHNLALFETLENKLQSLTLKTISHKITLVVPNCKMMSAHAHFVNVHLFLTFLLLALYSLHFSLLLLIHSKASPIEFSVYFYSANEVIELFLLIVSLTLCLYFYTQCKMQMPHYRNARNGFSPIHFQRFCT